MEFTLLGAVAVAIVAIHLTLRYESGRTNAADCTRDLWDALVAAMVIGLVIGRLVAMIRAGTNPLTHPGDILIVRGGVDTVAATLSGLLGFAFSVRSDLWWLADSAAPAAVAGLAGWHAGCVVRDGCLGTASNLPWAYSQSGSAITRHPVEIYTALALIVLVVALVLWKRSRPALGVSSGVALLGSALVRLVTEPMRPGLGEDLFWWYAAGAVGAVALVVWRWRTPAEPHGRTL